MPNLALIGQGSPLIIAKFVKFVVFQPDQNSIFGLSQGMKVATGAPSLKIG